MLAACLANLIYIRESSEHQNTVSLKLLTDDEHMEVVSNVEMMMT